MTSAADPIGQMLRSQGYVVIDGAMATELERHGADLDDPLWSARCLIESPELVHRVHSEYLHAGADVLISATYQASVAGFMERGMDEPAATRLIRLGVVLAQQARDEFWSDTSNRQGRLRPLVAASVGPFGACLYDGSEYHGNYRASWHEVAEFHHKRLDVLVTCEPDLLAFETIPSLREAEILLDLLEDYEIPAWLSFSCWDEQYLSHGEPFIEGVKLAARSGKISAVGVNCTPPKYIGSLLQQAAGSTIPLLVYPNSGETWVPEDHCWIGAGEGHLDTAAWYQSGARLIGGCCRTGPSQIAETRAELAALAGNPPSE